MLSLYFVYKNSVSFLILLLFRVLIFMSHPWSCCASFSPALHHCCNSTEQLTLLAEKHTNKSAGMVQEIKCWGGHLHFWKLSRRKHLHRHNFSKWLPILWALILFPGIQKRKGGVHNYFYFFFFLWTLKQLVTLFFFFPHRVRRTPIPAVHLIQMYLWKKTGKQCGERQSDRPRHSWKKQR